MEEIAKNIFLESGYPGVVLGVLQLSKGVLLIDAPFRLQDVQDWSQKIGALYGNADKLLVMLDAHIDRALGIRAMGLTVLGHQNAVNIMGNRPTMARAQDMDAGAEWEPYELPANIHWAAPDISYTNQMCLHWDERPVEISHQPGSHYAGSWVRYDASKVIFVGDSLVLHQPPFLAWSDLDRWIEELTWLGSDTFRGYKIITSRNGIVRRRSIARMIAFLTQVKILLADLAGQQQRHDAINDVVPALLRKFSFDRTHLEVYKNRLVWGLDQYLQRHYPKVRV